ncbi:NAD(P)-dependent dehydrogenase (short-subunit alcohol dehydrogenase family) [Bradyrhizobium japonicum]
MQVTGKVVVVTGGANGIGKALCEAFHKAGAAKVVVADMDRPVTPSRTVGLKKCSP